MDRVLVQRYLTAAESREANGELRLERQRAIIDRLRGLGRDIGRAETLLVGFEQQQTIYRFELEWLREQLATGLSDTNRSHAGGKND